MPNAVLIFFALCLFGTNPVLAGQNEVIQKFIRNQLITSEKYEQAFDRLEQYNIMKKDELNDFYSHVWSRTDITDDQKQHIIADKVAELANDFDVQIYTCFSVYPSIPSPIAACPLTKENPLEHLVWGETGAFGDMNRRRAWQSRYPRPGFLSIKKIDNVVKNSEVIRVVSNGAAQSEYFECGIYQYIGSEEAVLNELALMREIHRKNYLIKININELGELNVHKFDPLMYKSQFFRDLDRINVVIGGVSMDLLTSISDRKQPEDYTLIDGVSDAISIARGISVAAELDVLREVMKIYDICGENRNFPLSE